MVLEWLGFVFVAGVRPMERRNDTIQFEAHPGASTLNASRPQRKQQSLDLPPLD